MDSMDYTSPSGAAPSQPTTTNLHPDHHHPSDREGTPFRPPQSSPNGRYRDHSAASSTASSESDDDDPGPDQPRRGDDRNLRIEIIDSVPTAPALATPNARLLGSHPWPFTSNSPGIGSVSGGSGATSMVAGSPPGGSVARGAAGVGARMPDGMVADWLKTVPASSMPHEILLQILRSVSATADLRRALLVCKAWCQCGVELLWHKPSFPSTSCLIKMLVTLASKTQTFPYASFIRRLNFSGLAENMTDHILGRLNDCHRLERLTLSSCSTVSDEAIIRMLKNVPDLVALDLSDCKLVTDAALVTAAQSCLKLQGLNLTGCKNLTDVGVGALKSCRALRRLKLKGCEKVTDKGLTQVAANCPLLLEVGLVGCKLATNATLWTLWKNSSHLRELCLSGLVDVSDGGFPSSDNPLLAADGGTDPLRGNEKDVGPPLPPLDGFSSPKMHYDHIRFLDLTSLAKLTDDAVAGIVRHMPRIRNFVLAKCSNLTDESLNSICKLGKHLHYLHLGHVSSLTDRAVIQLARSCTRLRYIDLACCTNLTDMSVFELATCLPRLKRIGLVRVTNITDNSVNSLLERTSLERIHLSYCDHISVGAIHWLLQKLHRLTHLSLTGVPAFRRSDLQTFCRAPPKDFNSHQRQAFCVYSGKGVNELRRYLSALYYAGTNYNEDSAVEGNDASVFSEMPDQRTMAMALAAVRAASSGQANGVHSSRRRLGERSNAAAPPINPLLAHRLQHGAPAPVFTSYTGLRYPGLNNEQVRIHDPGAGGNTNAINVPLHNGVEDWDARSGSTVRSTGTARNRSSNGPSRAEMQAGHDFFASAMGNQPTFTFGSVATSSSDARPSSSALQSPIPLYATGPSNTTDRPPAAGPSRLRAYDDAALGLGLGVGPSSASRDRVASSDGTARGAPRPGAARSGTLLRRRSTQEMSTAGAAAEEEEGGRQGERSALGLEVPDRTGSASPMDLDLSDDERPDPR